MGMAIKIHWECIVNLWRIIINESREDFFLNEYIYGQWLQQQHERKNLFCLTVQNYFYFFQDDNNNANSGHSTR